MGILRLKEILKERKVTGKELASIVGLSEIGMSNIVKGQSLPREDVLLRIASALDIDIRELFISTKSDTNTEILNKAKDIVEYLKTKT